MDGREEKWTQNFGRKTLRKEVTWKTWVYMEEAFKNGSNRNRLGDCALD
jgi:hypothetical protein